MVKFREGLVPTEFEELKEIHLKPQDYSFGLVTRREYLEFKSSIPQLKELAMLRKRRR